MLDLQDTAAVQDREGKQNKKSRGSRMLCITSLYGLTACVVTQLLLLAQLGYQKRLDGGRCDGNDGGAYIA